MDENSIQRRWDTDQVGHGIADGSAYAPSVRRLLDALLLPDWVAEDPDIHLLPHLQRACEATPGVWRLGSATFSSGVYTVTLNWQREDGNVSRLRADMFSLIGAVAEGVTHVHQQMTRQSIMFEVITGLLDGETQWRGHGHLIQFRVEGEAVQKLLR